MGTGSVFADAIARIARQISVERQRSAGRGGARGGHGDGQDGVGAEFALVRRAVGFDHAAVERRLIGGVQAADGLRDAPY